MAGRLFLRNWVATKLIRIKRVYEPAEGKEDGYRVLVDRLWPRGVTKEKAKVDLWMKEIGPSDQLRKWFSHDPKKWDEFQARYRKELSQKEGLLKRILEIERERGTVTLVFSSKEEHYNNAVAIRNVLK